MNPFERAKIETKTSCKMKYPPGQVKNKYKLPLSRKLFVILGTIALFAVSTRDTLHVSLIISLGYTCCYFTLYFPLYLVSSFFDLPSFQAKIYIYVVISSVCHLERFGIPYELR